MHDCWPISLKRSIQLCAPYLTNKPENLLQWVQRRHQLVEMLTAERNRLRAMSGSARADIETHIDWLEKRLVRLDEELERLIADNPVWKISAPCCTRFREFSIPEVENSCLYDALKTGTNPNVGRELTLVDWVWISGALIFLALMCFCIVLLANQFATTPAQGIPVAASLRPLSESNREAHTQSVTTVTPQESQYSGFVPPSAQSSSDVPNEPTKWTQSRSVTDKLATN